MAKWTNAVITDKGSILENRILSGGNIEITSVKAGEGSARLADLRKQTDLLAVKQVLSMKGITSDENTTTLSVLLASSELDASYSLQQIGFYANDPVDGEILYAIAQAEDATVIPSKDDMPMYAIDFNFYFSKANDVSMSCTVDPAAFVKVGELEEEATARQKAINIVQSNLTEHEENKNNPHSVTKSQVGLGNVENKSSATIRSEITKENVTDALGYTPLEKSLKGTASGLAELDENGIVPSSQLPAYVDDVLEYASKASFPITGESGKIYVAQDTNLTYRWSGTAYTEISKSLALGTTSSTAYRGDLGNTAYTHSQKTSGNPHNVTATEVGLGNVPNVATNDQTPTYTAATSNTALTSGEKLSVAMGKIAKAVSSLISHLANTSNPHSVTKSQVGLGNVNNTSDANKPISTATQTALDNKVNKVSGKGLSTNDYTTTEKNKLEGIEASANNYSHPNSGATAGTYRSVTVDAQGHVTGGSNPTVTVAQGGTGQTTIPNTLKAYFPNSITAGSIPLLGTGWDNNGYTSIQSLRSLMGLGNTKEALPVANGGTGKTTAADAANAFINALTTGDSTPQDADYFISQYAGGGTTNTTYHRRPLSALWAYIKSKADSVYAKASHGTHVSYGTSASALGTSSAGSASTVSRSDHVHALPALTSCTGTLTVAKGGTGATTAAAARTNLGLGAAATASTTSAITSGSAALITSGAVYSGLAGKADYEAGTCTLNVGKTSQSGKWIALTGRYIRIGKLCYVFVNDTITTMDSTSGYLCIKTNSLPFAKKDLHSVIGSVRLHNAPTGGTIHQMLQIGWSDTTPIIQDKQVTNGFPIQISFIYEIA